MWGKTKTFKIVYYDNNVMSGDKRRSTFVEAYNRQDAIHKPAGLWAGIRSKRLY